MKSLLVAVILLAGAQAFADAEKYRGDRYYSCVVAAEQALFEEITKYDEEAGQKRHISEFDFESVLRFEGTSVFVTTETLIAVEGPYDGTWVIRWDYGVELQGDRSCKVVSETELENEIYD